MVIQALPRLPHWANNTNAVSGGMGLEYAEH